ncbi:MAG TPA: MFS transporter [Actinomycetota bacterium]|nr:MFS transporter [Actinomycetota bacterium]
MSEPEPAPFRDRIAILRPLAVRDFAFLWTGMTVSMIGDGIYLVSIAWQVLSIENRPGALALAGIAWSLPQVLLVIASGALSDRLERRHLMIAGDAIRFFAIGALGLLSISGQLTIPIVLGLVTVYGAGQAVFQPAFSSITPAIVPAELLVQANSLAQLVRPFAMMLVGPLVGGLLIAWVSVGFAFLVDASTFAFSALMILAMRTRRTPRDAQEQASFLGDVAEGLRYVRRQRWLLIAMVGATVSLLAVWGPWETLVPIVVKNDLGGKASSLGFVFGAGGVGAVIAAARFGQRGSLPRKPVTAMYLAWSLGMFGTAGFGLVTSVWQAMAVAFVTEGSITYLVVVWVTLVQRLVPDRLLGRVFSLDWMISTMGVPLSFAITGPTAEAIGHDATLIWAGALGGTITLLFMFVRGARDPERDGSLVPGEPSAAAA